MMYQAIESQIITSRCPCPYADITPNSSFGKYLGFNQELFDGILYGSISGITVAYIFSKHPRQGNVINLYQKIHELGYNLRVVDCCPEMEKLCQSMDMEYRYEYLPEYDQKKEFYLYKKES